MYLLSKDPTYRLRAGDTMYILARRHGFPLSELIKLNPKLNPHAPRPGATVRMPSLKPGWQQIARSVEPVAPAEATEPSPPLEPLAEEIPLIQDPPTYQEVFDPIELASAEEAPAPQPDAPLFGNLLPTV